jgi:hypothetical protein
LLSIRDERFERFMYAVVVFKSLMFEAQSKGALVIMAEGAKGNRPRGTGGFIIIGLSLALLLGVALLKGRADSGGELDE